MASIDPNSYVGQAQSANNSLAAYFNAVYLSLLDTTGTVPMPNFNTVPTGFDYSDLIRVSNLSVDDPARYSTGAAIENVHNMMAISREFDMRQKTKVEYYSEGTTGSLSDSNYYTMMAIFWVGVLQGIYREGSTV